MIITIDGLTASGKSTVAQIISKELNIYYLNSGFLYRAIGYILDQAGYNEQEIAGMSEQEISKLIDKKNFKYSYDPENKINIFYKDQNITKFLKTPKMDKLSSTISRYPNVRTALLEFQRNFAKTNSLIIEGRDTGTIVFPNADFKFFLTARPEIRARRWQLDQQKLGNNFSLDQALDFISERDSRDTNRSNSPCVPAPTAFIIDNSNIDLETTAKTILQIINKKK